MSSGMETRAAVTVPVGLAGAVGAAVAAYSGHWILAAALAPFALLLVPFFRARG